MEFHPTWPIHLRCTDFLALIHPRKNGLHLLHDCLKHHFLSRVGGYPFETTFSLFLLFFLHFIFLLFLLFFLFFLFPFLTIIVGFSPSSWWLPVGHLLALFVPEGWLQVIRGPRRLAPNGSEAHVVSRCPGKGAIAKVDVGATEVSIPTPGRPKHA